jgi:endonuclease/exonuclease/phosphatase family metal-dependent hydrolase/predicted kinase
MLAHSRAVLHIVVLVGPPGSGKSTFAQAVASRTAPGAWRVINQDLLGSRGACVRAMAEALNERQHILVDRCNFDPGQRQPWIELARWAPLSVCVSALVFTLSVEQCKTRVLARTGHPTLSGPGSGAVVERMAQLFVAPARQEGFDYVGLVPNERCDLSGGEMPADAKVHLDQLVAAPLLARPRPASGTASAAVRVATFNLLANCWVNTAWYPSTPAESLEPSARLAAAARAIRALGADIVCLQEAEDASLNGLADLLAGEYAVSALARNEPSAAQVANGVAFLVREGCASLAGPWRSERRLWNREGSASALLTAQCATRVGTESAGGAPPARPLAVLNSHLAWGQPGEEQARRALGWARDWMAQHPDGILVWCGDFNLPPTHPLASCMLAAGLQDALRWSTAPTYFPDQARVGARPGRCDYILFSAHSAVARDARAVLELDADANGDTSSDDERLADGTKRVRVQSGDGSTAAAARRQRVARPKLKHALALCGSDHIPLCASLEAL